LPSSKSKYEFNSLDANTYLTGHGDMMTKADVQKKLDLIQDKYNRIKAMVAQGKPWTTSSKPWAKLIHRRATVRGSQPSPKAHIRN